MRLESARDLKAEIAAAAGTAAPQAFLDALGLPAGDAAAARRWIQATGLAMPEAVGIGIAPGTSFGDYHLAIRTEHPAVAEALRAKAGGEADVRILRVEARTTPGYLQAQQRPLEPGLSIGLAAENSAGTLGAVVRDRKDRWLGILSNSHVIAGAGLAQIGSPIVQPANIEPGAGTRFERLVGVLARFVPFSTTTRSLVDCAVGRLDKTSALLAYNAAAQKNLLGARDVTPADLGSANAKIGRTTAIRAGRITAVEIDGLPVGYSGNRTVRFDDQIEFSGGPGAPAFSAAGDSGSLIVNADGYAVALLFAGGSDSRGEDFTYGNRIGNVLRLLDVDLVVSNA